MKQHIQNWFTGHRNQLVVYITAWYKRQLKADTWALPTLPETLTGVTTVSGNWEFVTLIHFEVL